MCWKIPLVCLKTGSLDPLRWAGALNFVERGAQIHPSAVVEGCWLREGAKVGPGAVIRGCILGEGAVVDPDITDGAVKIRRSVCAPARG